MLAVGSQGEGYGTNTGAVYLFSFDLNTPYTNLVLNRTLENRSVIANTTLSLLDQGYFGSSLALSNYLLAVGAMGDSTGGTGRGAEYLFSFDKDSTYNNLSLNLKLANGTSINSYTALDLKNNDYFGSSVALYDNLIAVGAMGSAGGGTNRGALYLLYFDEGTDYKDLVVFNKLTNGSIIQNAAGGSYTFSIADNANFGSSVALTNGLLAIGSKGDVTGGGSGKGAAYLLSFTAGSNYNNLAYNTKLASGSTILNASGGNYTFNFSDNANFGSSIALTNRLLAIGSQGDTSNTGAVYLLSFNAGTNYTSLKYNQKLSSGLGLTAGDYFGSGLALTNGLLTVGAQGDSSNRGAAYLFNFTPGSEYGGLTFNQKLANLSTIGSYVLNLNAGDNFGCSIALNNNLLTIGAKNDDTGGTNRGAVYLISYDTGTPYSNLTFDTKLADGSTIINPLGGDLILNLNANANFGSATALYNDLFAVGASGNNTGGINRGGAYLFNIIDQSVANYTFSAFAADTLYLSAARLASLLTLQNITLQANNDINVLSAIAGGNHNLTMQAGRSVDINANITTGNANLNIVANETHAIGVVDAYRDPGAAEIAMAADTTINAGTGNITMTLKAGNDKTNFTSDSITLNNITAKTINVANQGLTAGSNVLINGAITASGIGSSSFSSTGAITQSIVGSGFSMTGPISFTAASTQNISLTNPTNNFIGAVSIVSGNNVSLTNNTATQLGASTISSNFNLISNGAISQTGALTINGTTSLAAGAGNDINLDNSLNDFVGNVSIVSGDNVSITDVNALQMGTSTISGNLALVSNGALTQSGAISVVGNSSLNAGTVNNITLNNASNDFGGAVSIATANDASITDQNSLMMGESDVKNNLTLTAIGNITQNAKIKVGNNTYLNTPADITLTHAGNDFCNDTSKSGAVYINNDATLPSDYAHSANLNDANNIGLGDMNIANGLTLNANGYVAQNQTKKLNIIGSNNTITAGTYITVYTAKVGAPSSIATLKLDAGTINPDDVNLVAADIYGKLIVNAAHDINVIEVITGHTNDVFSFTAGNDINIGTTTQPTPTSVITGGAAFTATAGRSFNMIGNSIINPTLIDTAGGNITITANNVAGHSGLANIAMSGNTLINAGSGNVVVKLLNTTNANAGTMTLRDITGSAITAWNQSLAIGTDVILNGILNATGITANPLIVSSDGGNFINNKGSGALVTDPTQRWLVYSGSPAETTLGGLSPTNTYYSSTIYTIPPATVAAGNSVLYRVGEPYSGGGGGGNAAAAAASAAAIVPATLASAANYGGVIPLILYPLVYVRPEGITGAAVPVIDLSRPMYKVLVDKKGNIKRIEIIP